MPAARYSTPMLGDPKKLKTRAGHGYLVSWKDRLRVEDDAHALAKRILDDPHNVAALRQARGNPSATMDELAHWLSSGLAGGSFALLRTEAKPRALRTPPEVDLRNLIRGDGIGADTTEPEQTRTFVSVEVIDTAGQCPGAGELRFSLNGRFSTHLASEYVRRGELRPEAQAAAGCLDLDFRTSTSKSSRLTPPIEPAPTENATITFEVVSASGEPLDLGFRVTRHNAELVAGRTSKAAVQVPGPASHEPVQLELHP